MDATQRQARMRETMRRRRGHVRLSESLACRHDRLLHEHTIKLEYLLGGISDAIDRAAHMRRPWWRRIFG